MKGSLPVGKRKVERRPGLSQHHQDAGRVGAGTSSSRRECERDAPLQGSPSCPHPPAQGAGSARALLQVCMETEERQAAGTLLSSMCAPDVPVVKASEYRILFIITIITILIT